MSFFVVDKTPDAAILDKDTLRGLSVRRKNKFPVTLQAEEAEPKLKAPAVPSEDEKDSSDDETDDLADVGDDFFGLPPPSVDLKSIISSTLMTTTRPPTKVEEDLAETSELVDDAILTAVKNSASKRRRIRELDHSNFNLRTRKFDDEDALLGSEVETALNAAKSTVSLEAKTLQPMLTKKNQAKLNRIERAKTKGSSWYGLPATELTEEVENDLKLLQMRSVLDPKHFYKKNDLKVLPKYFQIGTVQHSPLDYFSERNTRRNKKHTLVDELLGDAEALTFTKRKFQEITARKDKYAHRKAMKKMKKLKKK